MTAKIDLHNPSQFPVKVKRESFSVDVIIIDEFGLLGIGYYDFKENKWSFHTDTLRDYDRDETKWKWFYSPVTAEMV